MNAREAVVTVLLRGLDGKSGVGRVEARELARRFGGGNDFEFFAVKWHGEWYVVQASDVEPDAGIRAGSRAWSVGQAADWLWRCERGRASVTRPSTRPEPRYVIGETRENAG